MIICVGSSFLDRIIKIDLFPNKPIKIIAKGMEDRLGGSAAVAACTISKLGAKSKLFTKLGDDDAKSFIIQELKKFNVDLKSVIKLNKTKSSQSHVFEDQNGERLLAAYNELKLLNYKFLPNIKFDKKFLYVADLRWMKATSFLAKQCFKQRLDLVVDLDNFKKNKQTEDIVNYSSYPIFSETGLQEFTKESSPILGLKKLIKKNSKFYGVTMGENGVYWYENKSIMYCRAPKIRAVETNCAGDVFHGAFAYFIYKNFSLSESIKFATMTASLKCKKRGGIYSIPSLTEVKKLAKQIKIKIIEKFYE